MKRLALVGVLLSVATLPAMRAMQPLKPAVPDAARPLPLTAVRLTGGPLKAAQDRNATYLLELEPDRMLAYYRVRAGLPQKAEPYGGWDGDNRNLTGHIAGHYLSGASLMYAATGDPRFKARVDYIIAELKVVQDAHGDGFLSALKGVRAAFDRMTKGEIRAANFDLNGEWSPWYTLHKTYAGLRDAYRFTGNRTALDLEIKYAQWAEAVLAKLDEAQIQRMLDTEFGGMNEIMVDLYEDTGDRRWLDLSYTFEHRKIIEPLQKGTDNLSGLHGNTIVPKLIGSADRYAMTGAAADRAAAAFFWDRVVNFHTFATGGHGHDEYFRDPGQLSDILDGRTAESCNVYNMLKLTRRLFALQPDIRQAEFHEQALFNHVLGSMDPETGATCYMVPVGRAVRKEYQNMQRSFTCCVGSGMESHALHGDGIYYESGNRLWVNLYAPSTAEWAGAGLRLTMDTSFPEGESASAALTLKVPKAFTLALRRPSWAGNGFAVTVNGRAVTPLPRAGSYVEINRTWRTGDRVAITLPKALHLKATPDNPRRAAVMWGPLVLAGDLGPEPERRGRGEGQAPNQANAPSAPPQAVEPPVLVAREKPIGDWLQPVAGSPGRFRTVGVGNDRDVELAPFYRTHRRTYAAYFDILTPAEFKARAADIAAERERRRKLEAATIVLIEPGNTEREREFNQQGENIQLPTEGGRPGRRGQWIAYDLPVSPEGETSLVVTWFRSARRPRTFEILVDGQRLALVELPVAAKAEFFDTEFPIPAALAQGKTKVTVRFQPAGDSSIATLFGVRMIRGRMPR